MKESATTNFILQNTEEPFNLSEAANPKTGDCWYVSVILVFIVFVISLIMMLISILNKE